MHPELEKAVEHLINGVENFKNDIWDSKEEGVTREIAERAAALLIYTHMFDHGIPVLDAADVAFAVEDVLENEPDTETEKRVEMANRYHELGQRLFYQLSNEET